MWAADPTEMQKVMKAIGIELSQLRESKSHAGYSESDTLHGSTLGQYRNQQFSIATRSRGSSLMDEDLETAIAKVVCTFINPAITPETIRAAFLNAGTGNVMGLVSTLKEIYDGTDDTCHNQLDGILYRTGRFMELALFNNDHFGFTAQEVYKFGMRVALNAAVAHPAESDLSSPGGDLKRALGMCAFACHFLTDLFASGHLRTPRKKMASELGDVAGGLFSKCMHDEDNFNGIAVQSKDGKSFTVFGDSFLFEPSGASYRKFAHEAVKTSVLQVLHAYMEYGSPDADISALPNYLDSSFDDFPALDIIPDLTKAQNRQLRITKVPSAPMFTVENGILKMRVWKDESTVPMPGPAETNIQDQVKYIEVSKSNNCGLDSSKMPAMFKEMLPDSINEEGCTFLGALCVLAKLGTTRQDGAVPYYSASGASSSYRFSKDDEKKFSSFLRRNGNIHE